MNLTAKGGVLKFPPEDFLSFFLVAQMVKNRPVTRETQV